MIEEHTVVDEKKEPEPVVVEEVKKEDPPKTEVKEPVFAIGGDDSDDD